MTSSSEVSKISLTLPFPPYNMEGHLNPSIPREEQTKMRQTTAEKLFSPYPNLFPENSSSERITFTRKFFGLVKASVTEITCTLTQMEEMGSITKSTPEASFKKMLMATYFVATKFFDDFANSEIFSLSACSISMGVKFEEVLEQEKACFKEMISSLKPLPPFIHAQDSSQKPNELELEANTNQKEKVGAPSQLSFSPSLTLNINKESQPKPQKEALKPPSLGPENNKEFKTYSNFFQLTTDHPILHTLSGHLLEIFSLEKATKPEEELKDTKPEKELKIFDSKERTLKPSSSVVLRNSKEKPVRDLLFCMGPVNTSSIARIFLFFIDKEKLTNVELSLACVFLQKLLERFFPRYQIEKVPTNYLEKMLLSSLSLAIKETIFKVHFDGNPFFEEKDFSLRLIKLWHVCVIDKTSHPFLDDHLATIKPKLENLDWNSPVLGTSTKEEEATLEETIVNTFEKLFSSQEEPIKEGSFLHSFLGAPDKPSPKELPALLKEFSITKQSYFLTLFALKKVLLYVYPESSTVRFPEKVFLPLLFALLYITSEQKAHDTISKAAERYFSKKPLLKKPLLKKLTQQIYLLLEFSLQIPRKEFFENLSTPHGYFFKKPEEEKKE